MLLHGLYKRAETDPLDRCPQALGEFTLLPVESNDLPCQRHGLVLGQILGKHPADLRGAATIASRSNRKTGFGAKKPDILHPGVAAAVGTTRDAHLELGRRRFAIELLVQGKPETGAVLLGLLAGSGAGADLDAPDGEANRLGAVGELSPGLVQVIFFYADNGNALGTSELDEFRAVLLRHVSDLSQQGRVGKSTGNVGRDREGLEISLDNGPIFRNVGFRHAVHTHFVTGSLLADSLHTLYGLKQIAKQNGGIHWFADERDHEQKMCSGETHENKVFGPEA